MIINMIIDHDHGGSEDYDITCCNLQQCCKMVDKELWSRKVQAQVQCPGRFIEMTQLSQMIIIIDISTLLSYKCIINCMQLVIVESRGIIVLVERVHSRARFQ